MAYSDGEVVILEQFMSGIGNFDIGSHVVLHHPGTLASAISLATEFETVKGPRLSISKPRVHNVQTQIENDRLSPLMNC